MKNKKLFIKNLPNSWIFTSLKGRKVEVLKKTPTTATIRISNLNGDCPKIITGNAEVMFDYLFEKGGYTEDGQPLKFKA